MNKIYDHFLTIDLIKKYKDKPFFVPTLICILDIIFSFAKELFEKQRTIKRTHIYKEDLIKAVFHPRRIKKRLREDMDYLENI